MKSIKLIFLGLIILNNLSAQISRRVIKLSGLISNKYQIKMVLNFSGSNVLGFYYYEKYKKMILLDGEMIENKITLSESPDYESKFKLGFIGELKGNSFTGIWIDDKDKNKTLSFRAAVNTDTLINLSNKLINTEGPYENIYSSEKYISSVDLNWIIDDIFSFEISNATESGCVGYLEGIIKLTDLKKGEYSGDLCEELDFSIFNKELTINEQNCDLHGLRCPFEGKYKKK